MRTINMRKVNELNDRIRLTTDDRNPRNGNASHHYTLTLNAAADEEGHPFKEVTIDFQNGPIKEVGYNGFTNEALLEVVIDRLRCFQDSPFSCRENALALTKIEEALNWLIYRTEKRLAQGVEGTHELHK